MVYYIIYFCAINILAVLFFGIDKSRAIRGKWRISEAVLFTTAVLGGSVGSLVGMYAFHHKTRKLYFLIGMPLILFAQIFLYLLVQESGSPVSM